MNKQTAENSDKTVLLEEPSIPLIFGWLIDLESERVWRIERDAFQLGSGRSVNVLLQAPAVKDLHCSIYWVADHFEINDHNSQAGTKVNDREVKRQDLADDDIISIGTFSFQFKCFKGGKNG